MNKKFLIVVLSLTLMGASLMAVAGQGWDSRGKMKHARYGIHMAEKNLFPPRMLLKFQEKIGLNEDQVKKIEKLHDQFQESMIRRKADIKIKELKLSSYLKEDQLNRKKMESMIRDVANMKTDMKIAHMNHLLDVKNMLSPDQLKKIEELKKNWRSRKFRQWRKPRQDGIKRNERPGNRR